MDKSTHFFGTSVFGQLIKLIDPKIISNSVKKHHSDRYVKKFTTKDHMISMLFSSFAKCSSLCEVSGAMLGLSGKTKHFQLNHIPKKSTLADVNKRRSSDVFGSIYNGLLKQYGHLLSDSRIKDVIDKQIEIFDSSTISSFKDNILKCVGRKPKSGKAKGGIKLHSVINVDEHVPKMVWLTSAATHDHVLFSKLKLDEGKSIDENIHCGVEQDEIIEVQVKEGSIYSNLKLRKVTFYDSVLKRRFGFLINLFKIRADLIAGIYKLRWQIELLFKQLKQNFPLKYFLGDNENAIKIQIYCALIANLLMSVIQKSLKGKWGFSNLVSFGKIHLFTYIHLLKFLENPDKDWQKTYDELMQPTLF